MRSYIFFIRYLFFFYRSSNCHLWRKVCKENNCWIRINCILYNSYVLKKLKLRRQNIFIVLLKCTPNILVSLHSIYIYRGIKKNLSPFDKFYKIKNIHYLFSKKLVLFYNYSLANVGTYILLYQ